MPRRRTRVPWSLALLLSALALGVQADPWDGGDELPARTLPELTHGSSEAHDLAARPGSVADVDLSHLPQDPFTSRVVTLDGVPARGGAVELQRLNTDGTQLLQNPGTTRIPATSTCGRPAARWWVRFRSRSDRNSS